MQNQNQFGMKFKSKIKWKEKYLNTKVQCKDKHT